MTNTDSGNALLDLVARADGPAAARVMRSARLLDVETGQTLQQQERVVESCYFPIRGVLTLTCSLDDDIQVNTLAVGSDGALHASVGTNLNRAAHQVICRLSGQLWEVDAASWHALVDSNNAVRRVVANYTDFMLQRLQQMLACEMHHDVESRVCRSLIELYAWQKERPLELTHKGLSELLGVRRTTITLVARALQDAGIISYTRGKIEISDLHALRQASCGCHDRH